MPRSGRGLEAQGQTFDAVLNIQGDEPFVHPEQINQLADMLRTPDAAVVTLAKSMPDDPEIHSPHRVKVVRNMKGRAQMFSRSPIPHGEGPWLQHVGLYGFTRTALEALVQLSPTPLEQREKLEQLRWLDHGWRIDVGTTTHLTPAVDTPEDLVAIEAPHCRRGPRPSEGANSARIFAPAARVCGQKLA